MRALPRRHLPLVLGLLALTIVFVLCIPPGLQGLILTVLGAGGLMAVTDRRIATNIYEDGSSELAVGLTEAQAQAVGTLAGYETADVEALTANWYIIANLDGGTIQPNVAQEELEDEAGNATRTVTTTDEVVVANTAQQTDDFTLALLKWLRTNRVPARYPLPANGTERQWRFFPSLGTRTIGPLSTAKGVRKQPFELVAKKAGGVGPEIGPVTLPASQADARWTPYTAYKDAAYTP